MSSRVGDYMIGEPIGKGNFSVVCSGAHVSTGQRCAIKIVTVASEMEDGVDAYIRREIAIMRKLDHPHVVKLFQVYRSPHHVYLVMELVTGGALFDVIVRNKLLPEGQARSYFQQLLLGVYYCHCNGIAHRDLKPENLLLDDQGSLKISDFGLSNLQP
eukprot:RCo037038